MQDLEPIADALRAALGLQEPFRDPGVGEFGLENVVFALGDCFLELVSPTRADTAAGRYLARRGGDGGYMVIFDLEDLEGARSRALELGVRTVWQIDLPDISGTHLHPADMRGAIVSLDRSQPYGTWRWGGPAWTGATATGAPGRLAGITIAVADPQAVAARWGAVLGVAPAMDCRTAARPCCVSTAARSASRRPPTSAPKGSSRSCSSSLTSYPAVPRRSNSAAFGCGGSRQRGERLQASCRHLISARRCGCPAFARTVAIRP